MGATLDLNKPAIGNAIDSDLDQIRNSQNFLLMIAAHGSVILPGWQTTANSTSSPQDFSQPNSIILTRGTREIHLIYTWVDDAVASIQMCYNDGVSSPGLVCFDAQGIVFDSDGNFTAGWSPISLNGLWAWLETDTAYLYQDAAKTTPVTADGDSVGCWADKLGSGNDFSTTSSPDYRPTYKTDYVRGDGTDEELEAVWSSIPDEWMIGISCIPRVMASSNGVFGSSAVSGAHSASPFVALIGTATLLRVYVDSAYQWNRGSSIGDECTFVIKVTKPAANYLVDCWIDGVKSIQYDAGTVLAGDNGYLQLYLAFIDNGQHDIPAFVVAHGTYDDDDAVNLATYLAGTF